MVSVKPSTPRLITGSIKRFLSAIGINKKPLFLPFTFVSDMYKSGYCNSNCEAEHTRTGCPIVFGWTIWQDAKVGFIEAEFHAVIRKNNNLVDITPRKDKEDRILYAIDEQRKAFRRDDKTWVTWSNFKSYQGNIIEEARNLNIRDMNPNKIDISKIINT